jgi:DNA-binding transcriptional MocR family regulator
MMMRPPSRSRNIPTGKAANPVKRSPIDQAPLTVALSQPKSRSIGTETIANDRHAPGLDQRIVARFLAEGRLALSPYYVGRPRERGFVRGFAGTPEDRIAPAVRILAAAIADQRPPRDDADQCPLSPYKRRKSGHFLTAASD